MYVPVLLVSEFITFPLNSEHLRQGMGLSWYWGLENLQVVYIPGPELFWNFREATLYGRLYLLGGPGTFCIVGKGGHTLPFLRFPLSHKSKASPSFIGLSGKQKY